MKKTGLFALFLLLLCNMVLCQSDTSSIFIQNGSFEDEPRCCSAPTGWVDCGFRMETPPDIQPALNQEGQPLFGVRTKAIFGKTYLGLVVRKNETYERVAQKLMKPMIKGNCYSFSIYLAKSDDYISGSNTNPTSLEKYNTPVKLRIWGGEAYCNQKELLAESDMVGNTNWQKFNFEFRPKNNISYLELEAYYQTPTLFAYNGNLLLDNASHIKKIPCPGTKEYIIYKKQKTKEDIAEQKTVAKEEAKSKSTLVEVLPKEKILKELEKENIKVGQTIKIEKLFFQADSSNIKPESFQVLDELYTFLKSNDKVKIEIGGHTNNIPSSEYCNQLSESRAKAVTEYLVSKGIDSMRINYKGYGKINPIASNSTKEGRLKNQRVEIKILSLD